MYLQGLAAVEGYMYLQGPAAAAEGDRVVIRFRDLKGSTPKPVCVPSILRWCCTLRAQTSLKAHRFFVVGAHFPSSLEKKAHCLGELHTRHLLSSMPSLTRKVEIVGL